MSNRTTTLLLLSAATTLGACSSPALREPTGEALRYADAICSAAESCDCPTYAELGDTCRVDFAGRFDAARSASSVMVDEDCLSTILDRAEVEDCRDLSWFTEPGLICLSLTGTKTIGAACSAHRDLPLLFSSECTEDLLCSVEGTCVFPEDFDPDIKEAGDPCSSENTPLCNPDLYCGSDDLCHPRKDEDEACTSAFECAGLSTYCRGGYTGSGTCLPRLAQGEPCDPLDHRPCADDPEDDDAPRPGCSPENRRCGDDRRDICEAFADPRVRPAPEG